MKKRFGFSLDENLHEALRARAEEEGVSMAALCREALQIHLQRPALDCNVLASAAPQSPALSSFQEPSHYSWEVDEWQDPFRELDDFLAETFQPEHTPDLFFQEENNSEEPSPGWLTEAGVSEPSVTSSLSSELAIYERSAPSFRRGRIWQSYNTRLLDELWA